ncbi:MAG: hypothetical protein AAF720_12720 [Pseudomonadota bacterium]
MLIIISICKPVLADDSSLDPVDDISHLSDDFSDPERLSEWQRIHAQEGWSNKLKRIDVNQTAKGALFMEPHTSVWFYDYVAPFLFKAVDGDFMVTTRVRVKGTDTDYPESIYSLAGLMLRAPRKDAPYRDNRNWAKDRETYVFAVTGTTEVSGQPILETKSTIRSYPLVKHYKLKKKGWLDIRLVRTGKTVLVLYRYPSGRWVLHERFYRPDLPTSVQVGLMAYSDFATIREKHWYMPWEYNVRTITDGKADLQAEFDYVDFRRIAVPTSTNAWLREKGIELDDTRIDNSKLFALLPFIDD